VKINETIHYLWRAVDQHGNVLDIVVQSRRNALAATKFLPQTPQGPAIRTARHRHRRVAQLSGRSPRDCAVGDPPPVDVPEQSSRELPSTHPCPGAGDETPRLAWARPTVPVRVQPHPRALWAPPPSDQRTPMADRNDRPLRGLEPDHYHRSGLKDAVRHCCSSPNRLTSTAPQAF
jgi:DDE domain